MISHFYSLLRLICLILCIILLGLGQLAWSTDYYVTAKGSDMADGQSAVVKNQLGTSGPFATLRPLSQLTFQEGDRIFLACGERFQGPLRLSLQNKPTGTLTISQYGSCSTKERPVIHGRSLVELEGSGRALRSIKMEGPVVQVFSGNSPIPRARFPESGYLILPENAISSNDRIPVIQSLRGKKLAGASVYARTQEWFIEEKTIVSEDGVIEGDFRYPLRPKSGFYLAGKAWMIGEGSGWAYDYDSKTLHVRTWSVEPIAVVLSGHLLQIEGKGSVSIKGVALDSAGGDAINLKLDGMVKIDDVLITRSVGNGVAVFGSPQVQITNSHIEDSGLDGIFFAEVAQALVNHNMVVNSGIYLGPRSSLAAINAHRTQSATINENEVLRSAYIGIRVAGDARVHGNIVKSACLFLSDCGAIYTWRRGSNDLRAPVVISRNTVIDVVGDTTVKFGVFDYFSGIYLDEWTRATTVRDNIVVNSGQGIYLHNARGNIVEGNYIFGARHLAIVEKDDAPELAGAEYVKPEVLNIFINNLEVGGGDR
ncbi:right-handed parallel beta-helix repeat-containing protein [Dechloromonas sp. ZS-1]|uniref:right-handed parallel beta-helix repeat-containing protein n=1 Tax=Dechloromonas sp. ZS-1 TaxID=3138067 RepID=UPI0031FBFB39